MMDIEQQETTLGFFFSKFITNRSALAEEIRDQFRLTLSLLISALQAGHTCIELDEKQEQMLSNSHLVSHGPETPLVVDQHRLYLARYFMYERQLAANMRRLADISFSIPTIETMLDYCFAVPEMSDHWQRQAGQIALTKALCIISGGPGTGKTTTVVRIAGLLLNHFGADLRIALAAPTGKAAARLKESVRQQAQELPFTDEIIAAVPTEAETLHRLLGGRQFSSSFRHSKDNPLNWDVIIVDEASMVDLALMSKLVEALSPGARLILLGDKDQLASVESGSVLSDCMQILTDNVVELRTVYRFNEEIAAIAGYINRGESAAVLALLDDPALESIVRASPDWLEYAGKKYIAFLDAAGSASGTADVAALFSLFSEFRILCAVRQGPFGVHTVNDSIERFLASVGFECNRNEWYIGKPIIVTRNDYTLGLYNGDIGICLPDFDGDGDLVIWFESEDGEYRTCLPVRLPASDTVWAMTIHKSQGSEFDEVLVLLPEDDIPILSREILYTAVTRAREKALILGENEVFETTISRRIERLSGFTDNLRAGM